MPPAGLAAVTASDVDHYFGFEPPTGETLYRSHHNEPQSRLGPWSVRWLIDGDAL